MWEVQSVRLAWLAACREAAYLQLEIGSDHRDGNAALTSNVTSAQERQPGQLRRRP
jgi:hypothetical protein